MNCQCKDLTEINGRKAQDYSDEHLQIVRVGNWEIEYVCLETGVHWLMDYPHG
jgi:hypothetical protein